MYIDGTEHKGGLWFNLPVMKTDFSTASRIHQLPVWDDILTPLYIDPGVNISYDILTPGSIYRNDILTPLTIYWPPSQYAI